MAKNKSGPGITTFIVFLFILFFVIPKESRIIVVVVIVGVVLLLMITKKKSSHKKSSEMIIVPEKSDELVNVTVTNQRSTAKITFSIPTPPSNILKDGRWVPVNETFEVAGYKISEGLVYFGTNLPSKYGLQEPSLINPKLRIDKTGNLLEHLMGYWPSYSNICPQARGAYLSWLATGRNNPEADVGYVFLFFYGLERRMLLDWPAGKVDHTEYQVIKKEVERLLSIYGEKSGSVRSYFSNFLQMLDLNNLGDKLYEKPIPSLTPSFELHFYLRLALGQTAIDKVPVPSHLALAWAMNDPQISKKTPVLRCVEEFSTLFCLKYNQRYNEGIVLPVNKTKLRFNYHPASSALQDVAAKVKTFGDIPDIAAILGPQKKVQTLVDECALDLDSYSRFIGKSSVSKNYFEALIFLPITLWSDSERSVLMKIKEQIGNGFLILKVKELVEKFGGCENLSKEKLLSLAKILEGENICLEPDIISYPYPLKTDDSVLLYILQVKAPLNRTTPEYLTAVLALQLGAAVAASDGLIHENEVSLLNDQLGKWGHLSEYHKNRLRAHLNLMLEKQITLAQIRKKLNLINREDQKSIISFISQVALADGEVTAKEITFLEKVYKTFEFDTAELYSFIHNNLSPVALPQEPISSKTSSTISLDKTKIERLRKETENVSKLLSGIFAENEEEPIKAQEMGNSEGTAIFGLDDAHAAFLRMLMSKPIWSRQELTDIATDLDLMLDGAIETINEATFQSHDQPLLEGNEPVEINREIREKVII